MKTSRNAAVEEGEARERISAWLDDDLQAFADDGALNEALSAAGRNCAAEYEQVGALLRAAVVSGTDGRQAFVARVMAAVEAEPAWAPAAGSVWAATAARLLNARPRWPAGWGGAALAAAAGIAGWTVLDVPAPAPAGAPVIAAAPPQLTVPVTAAPVLTASPRGPRPVVRYVSTVAPALQPSPQAAVVEPASAAVAATAAAASAVTVTPASPAAETVEPSALGPMRRDPDLDAYLRSRQPDPATPAVAP